MLASSWNQYGRKGKGGNAGKKSLFQAKAFVASTFGKPSYRAESKSISREPHSPSLSKPKLRKAQVAVEYYLLLLLAAVLAITVITWAAGFKTNQAQLQSNASAVLKNFTAFNKLTNYSYSNNASSQFGLEIAVFEPYTAGQPAFFQITAFSAWQATLAQLKVNAVDSQARNVRVDPSSWTQTNFSFSRTFSAQFYPETPGVYSITATSGNQTVKRDVLVR